MKLFWLRMGALSENLYSSINYWKEQIGTKLVSVPLPKNMGLALH